MNGIAVLVTMAVIGVDYGWQPGKDGQLEYIVQIEPALLDSLRSGSEIVSEIHPDARGVRRFRIRVGKGELPRVGTLAADTSPTRLSSSDIANPRPGGDPLAPPILAPGRPDAGLDAGLSRATLGGAAASPNRPGILNLPPPPALIGPDGKSSILVRPGSQDGPGGGDFNRAAATSADAIEPASETQNFQGWLNLPPPPWNDDSQPYDGSAGGSPPISAPLNPNPPGSGGDYSLPVTPTDPPRSNVPPLYPPSNERPLSPVPAPSFNDSGPAPIRGVGQRGGEESTREQTAADDPAKNMHALPTGPESRLPATEAAPGATDLAGNFADAQGAAAQKPAIDQETADKLAEIQAARPWLPLVLTSLALFASLAANLYLGWIAVTIYRRYRDMVDQLHQAQTSVSTL